MQCVHTFGRNIALLRKLLQTFTVLPTVGGGGGGGTPSNGLYGEASPKRGTFFTLQVYERVGKSVI